MEWYAPGGDQGSASAFVLVRDAYELLRAGRVPEAERTLGDVLSEQPDYDPALRLLGLLYARQGRHDDALAVYGRALRNSETRAETLNNMATVLMRQDALPQAEQRLRDALLIQPDQVGANLNLALIHMTRQEYEQAAPRLAAVHKSLPLHPGVLNNLAVCRMRLGDPGGRPRASSCGRDQCPALRACPIQHRHDLRAADECGGGRSAGLGGRARTARRWRPARPSPIRTSPRYAALRRWQNW
jgi:tetratricopeptide (TPR) repeat protein